MHCAVGSSAAPGDGDSGMGMAAKVAIASTVVAVVVVVVVVVLVRRRRRRVGGRAAGDYDTIDESLVNPFGHGRRSSLVSQ